MVQTAPVDAAAPNGPYEFDAKKAVETLLYVSPRTDGDLYRTLKAIYFADRLHLARYGRFIYGDDHCKLPFGPVPQGAYDILKHVSGRQQHPEFDSAKECLQLSANTVKALREPDLDSFSASEIECLEQAIQNIEGLPFDHIRDGSHDRAYEITAMGRSISPMMMAADEKDGAALVQYLEDSAP